MYGKTYVKRMMLYSCFTHILRMLNVRCTFNNLLHFAPVAVRGHGIHFALVRAQVQLFKSSYKYVNGSGVAQLRKVLVHNCLLGK